jgi:hypothetical protein
MRRILIAALLSAFALSCGGAPAPEEEEQTAQAAKPPRCGDGVCNGTENCSTCGRDCNCQPYPPNAVGAACVVNQPGNPAPHCEYAICGDGVCWGEIFNEHCYSCPADCPVCE